MFCKKGHKGFAKQSISEDQSAEELDWKNR